MTGDPKKKAPKTARAKPTVATDPGTPPLEAIDKPPTARPKRTPNTKRRGVTTQPTPDELVKLRERERLAVELAASGISDWAEIARLSGYADRSVAWRTVQRVLDRQEFAAVADYRHLIGYRYERIIRANWQAVIGTEESTAKDKATPRVFRAMEGLRRAFGLDMDVDKIAEAFGRIPEDAAERAAELIGLRDQIRELRVVGGTDIEPD